MSVERRIEDLEIKLAHLELGLQAVSDEVIRQQQLIERLTERGRQLQARLAVLQADSSEDAATRIEIPPHY
jgi:uncharacterized coiled-coil protein SlyX